MWLFFKPNVKRLQSKQDIEKLIGLLSYSDLNVVSAAATALGELEANDAVNPLAELLQIHGGEIGERSIEALENIGSTNAVNALIVVCETVGLDLCLRAIQALGRIGNFNCVEFLSSNLQSKSVEVAIESANSLGMIGDKTAIDPLVLAGKSDHDELALACQKALHKIGYSPQPKLEQNLTAPQLEDKPESVAVSESSASVDSKAETVPKPKKNAEDAKETEPEQDSHAATEDETDISEPKDSDPKNEPINETATEEEITEAKQDKQIATEDETDISEAKDTDPENVPINETAAEKEITEAKQDKQIATEDETDISEAKDSDPENVPINETATEEEITEAKQDKQIATEDETDISEAKDTDPENVPINETAAEDANHIDPDPSMDSKPDLEPQESTMNDISPVQAVETDAKDADEPELDSTAIPTKMIVSVPPKFHDLIQAKADLPSLPDIVRKITEKMRDPNCNLEDIADLIGSDPVLTSRIIKVANSSRYGSGKAVSSFTTAMVRLGFKEIQNITYSYALLKTFKSAQLINKKKFWLHSLSVGFCAQTLSILMGSTDEEQDHAYMAGLMHDIGIMVFCYLIPESYRSFLKRIIGDHKSDPNFRLQSEEDVAFHTDHSAIGAAYINHWWPVDEEVVISARDHHKNLNNNGISQTTQIVMIANMFCNSIGLNNGVNVQLSPTPLELSHFESLGLNRKTFTEYIELAKLDIETAKSILIR